MANFVQPFSERIKEIAADDRYLSHVMQTGKDKARESAAKTVKEVRKIIGFK